jgi:hypothetical protein
VVRTQTEGVQEYDADGHILTHRQEVRVAYRKLDNNKLHDLYSLADMSMAMKSRMIRWVEHVVHMT